MTAPKIRTALTEKFGIDYPIFGFTPSQDVAAAISRAGGLGVLGCVRFNDPGELDEVLEWMHENTDGKPFGVDVVMPAKIPTEGSKVDLDSMIPPEHRAFVERTLDDLGVPPLPEGEDRINTGVLGWLHSVARSHVDVSMEHARKYGQIKLIANALGSPPDDVIALSHENGVAVAALAGSTHHALNHVSAGVDIVIAQGYEGGGHTGEVTSMVLWPEVVDAVGSAPVLAAGGVGSGRQMAAALALGAQGVWMGTYWLTAAEYKLGASGDGPSTVQKALLKATSRDTVRSRIYSGKPARLLKTKWTQAWEAEGAPDALPMPLQNLLVGEAHARISVSDDPEVVAMPAGQIVGRCNDIVPVADMIADMVAEYTEAVARMDKSLG
ncbi:nitronate monooxygenase family protein [Gordonia alkaliphila]|uniref:Nitronate monooxygenase family protein n=1 Tax=Gordonia alkaliphila TaxID=1053547 RepID=A0ABP8YV76_9ACTN